MISKELEEKIKNEASQYSLRYMYTTEHSKHELEAFKAGARFMAEKLLEQVEALEKEIKSLEKQNTMLRDDRIKADHQRDSLKEQVETTRGIHTCHAQCKKVECVLRRELEDRKIYLANVEAALEAERDYSGKLFDVISKYATGKDGYRHDDICNCLACEALSIKRPGEK